MLEAMIKRLYIRRFPQTDTVASSGATDQKRPVVREKKPASPSKKRAG
jgi:hypothetical protein